jgi:hypothetical protein
MGNKIKDGGQAYPRAGAQTNGGWSRPTDGMSLRDYFAGQALAGIMSVDDAMTYGPNIAAKTAYQAADAMLAAREAS